MENTQTIYLTIGAFLLGMLFIAFLLKSILGAFGRTQQVIPPGGYHNYSEESSGTLIGLIFMVVVGSMVYFYSKSDLSKNRTGSSVTSTEALIQSTLEQKAEKSPDSDEAVTTENPVYNEDAYEEHSQVVENSGNTYLQILASSNYDRTFEEQEKFNERVGYNLETHIAQGEDEIYRLVVGPFDTKSEANKMKAKYGGYVIENPDYEFLD